MKNDQYYTNVIYYKGVPVSDEVCLYGIDGRMVDLLVIVSPALNKPIYRHFEVRLAMDRDSYSAVRFYPDEGIVEISQKHAGSAERTADCRRCPVEESLDGHIEMRIVLNGHRAEIFINEERLLMSMEIPNDISADRIAFYADGNAIMDVTKREIKT